MSWSHVVPDAAWETTYIVAGGPSLVGEDLTKLEGRTVLVVNDAVRHLPKATAAFSADRNWAMRRLPDLRSFKGEKYLAIGYEIPDPTIHNLRKSREPGLSSDPGVICSCSSGYGALNVAFLKGAKKIFLLGFDYTQGGRHWYPERGTRGINGIGFVAWAQRYGTTLPQLLEAGVQVWNANPASRIECFPKISFSDLLKKISPDSADASFVNKNC